MANLIVLSINSVTDPQYLTTFTIDPAQTVDYKQNLTIPQPPAQTPPPPAPGGQPPPPPDLKDVLKLQRIEVYSGYCALNAVEGNDVYQDYTYRAFLPIKDSKVRSYGDDTNQLPKAIVSAVVTASGFYCKKDANNAVYVDNAKATMRVERFPGIPPTVCLTLTFNIRIRNSTLWNVGYNVTVLTDDLSDPTILTLAEGTTPS